MKMENEITVLVNCDYETLDKELKDNGFEIKEKYNVSDIYMIDSNINIDNYPNLEVLSKCILVREIYGIKKILLYKYKKYADNGDIIEQGKVECPVADISKAILFMESINYKELFKIFDECIVYANRDTEIIVEMVNNEYIFIEMEQTGDYIDKKYETIDEMKKQLDKFNLDYNKSNYFVKKAEIMLEKIKNLE